MGASPRWSYLLAPQSQISAFQEGPNPRLTSWTSWGGAGTGLLREQVAGCGADVETGFGLHLELLDH